MKRHSIRRAEDLYEMSPTHPVETIANLDKIAIQENGEPFVDLRVACPGLIIQPLAAGKRSLFARADVARRLNLSQSVLNTSAPGYRIIVVDAWRPMSRQRLWHNLFKGLFRLRHPFWPRFLVREAANKYVAAPDALAPPPHSTGGAIDVRFQRPDCKLVSMGPHTPAACRTAYPNLSTDQRQNRDRLCAALESAGFSNYEEEWWHWSYGDSGWALRTNQSCAFYGRREPGNVDGSV